MTRSAGTGTAAGAGGVGPCVITTGPLAGAMTTGAPFSRSVLYTQPPSVAMSSGVITTIIFLLKPLLIFCPPSPGVLSPSREDAPGLCRRHLSCQRGRREATAARDPRLRALSALGQPGVARLETIDGRNYTRV